jgi:hypothetical protein
VIKKVEGMGNPPKKAPPPPPGAERRRAQRLTLMAQVELRRAGEVVVLPVGNISEGGLFLVLDKLDGGRRAPFRIGEVVSVFLAVDDAGEEVAMAIDAEVMRVDLGGANRPAGVGLKWKQPDVESEASLVRILARVATPVAPGSGSPGPGSGPGSGSGAGR